MKQRLEVSHWVPFSVELVFAFFANPHNLPHLMPPELAARIEDVRLQPAPARPIAPDPSRRFKSVAAGVGTEILISFYPVRWFPHRISWNARIVEFVWNSHFIDEQVRGPFASFRHRHGILSEHQDGVEGTRVTDFVEYSLPAGFLGLFAAAPLRKQMQQSFAYRQKRLPEILAAAARQAAQRA